MKKQKDDRDIGELTELSYDLHKTEKNKFDRYLEMKSKETQKTYRKNLKLFFEWKGVKPEQYLKGRKQKDYEKDIEEYWLYLRKKHKPVCTRKTKINTVRQFLAWNNKELSSKFWKMLFSNAKDKGLRPVTEDRCPTPRELRGLIYSAKPLPQALFLTLASSGARIGEILQITMDDLKLHEKPGRIILRAEYTKNHIRRNIFISDEATHAIKNWLDERPAWLKVVTQKLERLSKSKDKRFKNLDKKYDNTQLVFPINFFTATQYWQRMLKVNGLVERDPITNIRVLHIHTLRKFFYTRMQEPLGESITHALMGHSRYLDANYLRIPIEELGEKYLKAMNKVCIVNDPKTVETVSSEVELLKKENEELRRDLQKLMVKLAVK